MQSLGSNGAVILQSLGLRVGFFLQIPVAALAILDSSGVQCEAFPCFLVSPPLIS